MWCQVSKGQAEDSGGHICGVCKKGIGDNSILCLEYLRWVHERCSSISGKLKSNVDFHWRRGLEWNHVQSVLLKEVVIEPNVVEMCSAIWSTHLVQVEVWKRQQEPEWDVLELSSRSYLLSLTAQGASYVIKGKIYRACVQSVLTYGIETQDMKKGLERTERMMVRWMCGVSLKDRKRSVNLYSLLGVQSVANLVQHGRLRWFGHLEQRSVDDWVSACRKVEVVGVRCKKMNGKIWKEGVDDDMKFLGLHSKWAVLGDMWIVEGLHMDKRLTLA